MIKSSLYKRLASLKKNSSGVLLPESATIIAVFSQGKNLSVWTNTTGLVNAQTFNDLFEEAKEKTNVVSKAGYKLRFKPQFGEYLWSVDANFRIPTPFLYNYFHKKFGNHIFYFGDYAESMSFFDEGYDLVKDKMNPDETRKFSYFGFSMPDDGDLSKVNIKLAWAGERAPQPPLLKVKVVRFFGQNIINANIYPLEETADFSFLEPEVDNYTSKEEMIIDWVKINTQYKFIQKF